MGAPLVLEEALVADLVVVAGIEKVRVEGERKGDKGIGTGSSRGIEVESRTDAELQSRNVFVR